MTETLQHKIRTLPDSPGCYLMKSKGEIIYVGKAKNLKNRVRQYFHAFEAHTPKVRAMVSRVDDFDILLCRTNFEALTLECNLIKLHRPFYNILLKDDKHYPYLRYDPSEPFPRLTVARTLDPHDGYRYLGPYIGATAVRQVLNELSRYFPLRRCALKLPLSRPHRPCVYHSTGQCKAPCAGYITQEAYQAIFHSAIDFLNGDAREILRELNEQMNAAAGRMEYEQAAVLRDKIADVRSITERQLAIQTRDVQQDVLAVATDQTDAVVQVMHIRGGRIEGGQAFVLEGEGGDDPAALLESFLPQHYEDGRSIPREILVEAVGEDRETLELWLREQRGAAVTLLCPQRGEKAALVGICRKNAQDALAKRQTDERVRHAQTVLAMEELQAALHLPTLPERIEGYDISNTQGVLSVASMVVFHGGMPAKKQYRHFRIKTVEGANDFASMAEVIGRRFTHGLQEKHDREQAGLPVEEGRFCLFPDVILIDGGPQQLAFAHRAMQDAGVDLPMFGLAKRFEEIYLPGVELPIVLDKRSNALHLVQRVRDEAHRFGITQHRALRGKAGLASELSSVPGVGEKRKVALLRAFRSLPAIFAATVDELAAVPGMNRAAAEAVHAHAVQRAQGADTAPPQSPAAEP
ncbi:MAG: excinuclease ABC subunit UvrC [Candidatus Limiplasma sp.]|nr:excinuclease ABC subunit UvrC [Candidatus Limiplasma sp.]